MPPDSEYRPGRCDGCLLQPAFCVCATLPGVRVPVEVVVVRHWRERGKTSNSGRLVPGCVRGARLLDFGARDAPLDPAEVVAPGSWLVFPEGSVDADDAPPAPARPAAAPQRIVLLDGTWGQARRMSHRIPGLADLPRLALPPPRASVRRLRRPPAPWAVSTLEATALALEALGHAAASDALHAAYDRFYVAVRRQAGRPA